MEQPFWQQVILKVLDWPVLILLVVGVLMVVFRKEFGNVFRRGDIMISWGQGRSIQLTQLSNKFDQELDPIRGEIDAIKRAVTVLESAHSAPDGAEPMHATDPGRLSTEQREAAAERMLTALREGRYVWRSVERLAIIGGVSEDQALDILRADRANVVLSVGKSGQQIARLASRAR